MLKLLRQSPISARIGLAIIIINVVAALFAPLIAPYGETEVVGDVWLPMSWDHLLGTDQLGRDLFTRILYGARNTIAIAFVTTLLSFLIGIIGGFMAATLKGWTDITLSRIVDIMMALGRISCRISHQIFSPRSRAASTKSRASMSMATARERR